MENLECTTSADDHDNVPGEKISKITPELTKRFLNRIEDIHNGNIKIVSEYLGTQQPISYKCLSCDKVRDVKQANTLLNVSSSTKRRGCKECARAAANAERLKRLKEKFKDKLVSKPNVLVLREYHSPTSGKYSVECSCSTCRHVWSFEVAGITKKSSNWQGCPRCWLKSSKRAETILNGKIKVKNIEIANDVRTLREKRAFAFNKKILDIFGDKITLLTPYQGMDKPMVYKCNTCNQERKVLNARSLTDKKSKKVDYGCRQCYLEGFSKKKKLHGKMKLREKMSLHPTIEILSEEYTDETNKHIAKCKCSSCEHVWKFQVSSVTKKNSYWKGCPRCWFGSEEQNRARKTGLRNGRLRQAAAFKKSFYKHLKDNPTLLPLSPFVNSGVPMKFSCKKCNCKWTTRPTKIVHSNTGCPGCNQGFYQAKLDYENFLPQLKRSGIISLEDYRGSDIKIKHQCLSCEQTWPATPSSIKRGVGCPNCRASKGEKRISEYLQMQKIKFIPQWKDHTCIHKKKLAFDFYLPDQKIAIEFQGEQHERFVPYFHKNQKNWTSQKQRDSVKRRYCSEQEIDLIEIWHYEFDDIEKILHSYISKLRQVKN